MADGYYGIIYKATNTITNKIYIGQTVNKLQARINKHKCRAKKLEESENIYFYNSIRKYSIDKFIFEIIDCAENIKELNDKEIFWIAKLKSKNNKIGYNMTDGGGGFGIGRIVTPETRKKISVAHKGKPQKSLDEIWREEYGEEIAKQKRIETNKNIKNGKANSNYDPSNPSKKTLQKMSKSQKKRNKLMPQPSGKDSYSYGVKRSAETKEKMGVAKRGKNSKINAKKAKEIKEMLIKCNGSPSKVAKLLNVSLSIVNDIKAGNTWKWIK